MIYNNNAECEIIFLRSSLFNRTGRNIFLFYLHRKQEKQKTMTFAIHNLLLLIALSFL